MNKIVKSELYKNFSTVSFYVYTLIMIGFCILEVFILPSASTDSSAVLNSMHGAVTAIDIILVIFITHMVTYDSSNRTMKNIVSTGISRKKIYYGRQIAYSIIAVVILFLSMITLGICTTIKVGSAMPFTISNYSNLLGSFVLQTIVVLVIVSLCNLFGTVIRNQPIAMLTSIVIIQFNSIILGLVKQYLHIDLTRFALSNVLDDINHMKLSTGSFCNLLVVTFVLGVVVAIIGQLVFRKKQF